jgi:4'-phosphopantetheinyl transferase EntD
MAEPSTLHQLEQALLEISPDGVAGAAMSTPDLPPGEPGVPLKVRGKRSADIPVRQGQSGEQNADPAPQDKNVLPPQKRQNAASTIEQPRTINCSRDFGDVLTCVRGASIQRQREFFGGRQCARAALERCGIDSGLIGMSADQLPSWPVGFLGSISHSKGYCAAVAANRAQFSGLGLDLEKTNRLSDAAMTRVLHPDELVFAEGDQRQASLLFSAKEAFYKMQFPRWRTTANFHDLALSVDETSAVVQLEVVQISDRFSQALRDRVQEIRFRSRFFGDYVVSVCSMDASAVGVARG